MISSRYLPSAVRRPPALPGLELRLSNHLLDWRVSRALLGLGLRLSSHLPDWRVSRRRIVFDESGNERACDATVRCAVDVRELTMGVCGAVKAARRTEDENMPCPGEKGVLS